MQILHSVLDLFTLDRHREELVEMEGFGERSYENLVRSVEAARDVPAANVLYSLGIRGIGLSTARLIIKKFPWKLSEFKDLKRDDLTGIDGIGEVLAGSFVDFFADSKNDELVRGLQDILRIQYPVTEKEQKLEGKTFVITGSLEHFANRNECKKRIEELGGRVAGSVSSKTDYLVNNDTMSMSAKNKKAKELEIPILTEEELMALLEQ